MPFHLKSLWGATLMPLRGCVMHWHGTIVRVSKNSGPVQAACGPKFMKFWDNVGDPWCFPTPVSDCLCDVSFRRYLPLNLEVVKKLKKGRSFSRPQFFGGMTPTFLWQVVNAIYCPLFSKVWLISVRWSPSAKPGNEVESRIHRGWVKLQVQF